MTTYDEACRSASTEQGLDEIVSALRLASVAVATQQTGGMCMVAVATTAHRAGFLGITNDEDGYLVCAYPGSPDGEEAWQEGEAIAEYADLAEACAAVRSWVTAAPRSLTQRVVSILRDGDAAYGKLLADIDAVTL